ncbi:MAG TPA: LPS export ABC transporter periplasmic protein LptC [Thermoanaerobaculia bacterium]
MKGRRLELVVLAVAGAFVAILAVSFRPGRRPEASAGKGRPANVPGVEAAGEPTTLLDGFDFTETVGGKSLLRIQADRTIGYGPGAGLPPNLYSGEKVTLTAYPEDGEPITVLSDRATYDERSRESRLTGNVRWTDKDGGLAETEEAQFHPAARILEAPKTVHFTQGSMDITAPSAKYDLKERVVHFAGPVQGTGSGDESGGLSRLNARSALYRRDAGLLELEDADATSRSGDRFASDNLVIKLGTTGKHHPEWARATGNVRGILSPEGAASASGSKTAPPNGASPTGERRRVERQYEGQESLVSFDADGKARSFTLRGSPAMMKEPERRLTAPQIDVLFADGKAESARARGGVRIESADGHAEADSGSLGFGKDGETQNAALDGNVRLEEPPDRRAQSARAAQLDARGVWVLTGDGGHAARVESGRSRISAERIEMEQPLKQVRASGKARAVFSPDPARKERTPTFVGDSDRPTYGQGERIALDDERHLATLSGGASLWQDTSSLFAEDITLSDADKTVTAVENVRAVLSPSKAVAPSKDGGAGKVPAASPGAPDASGKDKQDKAASVILAKKMVYRDSDRTAHFEGGVTMTRGGLHATGGSSTAWLSKEGDQAHGVDRVEITGNVQMQDRTLGRSATADKALDYPKLGKTVLWGNPARVVEAAGNQIAGAVLTITDRGRSVEITAPEGGKTETIHRIDKD